MWFWNVARREWSRTRPVMLCCGYTQISLIIVCSSCNRSPAEAKMGNRLKQRLSNFYFLIFCLSEALFSFILFSYIAPIHKGGCLMTTYKLLVYHGVSAWVPPVGHIPEFGNYWFKRLQVHFILPCDLFAPSCAHPTCLWIKVADTQFSTWKQR